MTARCAGDGSSASSPLVRLRSALRRIEFHRFLIELSVRPGKSFTISDHLVPSSCTFCTIAASSSAVQSDLRTMGERWLCHRSRHCLPERPSIWAPIVDHRTFVPLAIAAVTRPCRRSSSSDFQTCFFQQSEAPALPPLPPLDGVGARASSSSSSLMTPEGVSPGASASGDAEAAHVDNFSKFPVAPATSTSSAGAANMQRGGICSGVAAHDEGCAGDLACAQSGTGCGCGQARVRADARRDNGAGARGRRTITQRSKELRVRSAAIVSATKVRCALFLTSD